MAGSERDAKRPPQRVGVREFRANMTGFFRLAQNGCSFVVTSRDEILAEIHPPSKPSGPLRRPGVLRGKIRMADDFDALPLDVLASMEGDEE